MIYPLLNSCNLLPIPNLHITNYKQCIITVWSYELCLDYVQESKKSKLLLGKNNSKEDEEVVQKTQEQQKDKFNLSHDEYYTAKNSEYQCSPVTVNYTLKNLSYVSSPQSLTLISFCY